MNLIVNCSWDFDADTFEGLSEEAKDFVSRLLVKEKRYLYCLSLTNRSDGAHRLGAEKFRDAGQVLSSVDRFCPGFLRLLLLWSKKGSRESDEGNQLENKH